MATENKSVEEMLAGALLEVGILLVTFAPIEMFFGGSKASWTVFVIAMSLGVLFGFLGIELERYRV